MIAPMLNLATQELATQTGPVWQTGLAKHHHGAHLDLSEQLSGHATLLGNSPWNRAIVARIDLPWLHFRGVRDAADVLTPLCAEKRQCQLDVANAQANLAKSMPADIKAFQL